MSRSRRSAAAGSGLSLTSGARVALRPLTEDDIALVQLRHEEAAAAASMATPDADARPLAIVRECDGTVIGLLDYRADSPGRGWLSVGFIALAAGRRGWGYGSEAVRLLEGEAKAKRFLARVDERNGLGLYFWLRLGYRPAGPDEVPGRPPRGMITMVRATEAA